MKRHFLLGLILVLCGFQLSAQNLTSEKIQEYGDTIIIGFTRATLPNYVKNLSKNDKMAYNDIIKPNLFSSPTSITSLDKLSELLRNNESDKFNEFNENFVQELREELNDINKDEKKISLEDLYYLLRAELIGLNKWYQYTNHDSITFNRIFNITDNKDMKIKKLEDENAKLKQEKKSLEKQLSNTIENETSIPKKILVGVILVTLILLLTLFSCMIYVIILLKKLCNRPSEQLNNKNNHEESDYRPNDKGISPSPSAYTQPRRGYAQKESDLSPSTPKAGKEKGKNYLPEQKSPTKEWDVSATSSNATVKGSPISPLPPSDVPQTKSILYAEVREDRLEITDSDNRQHYKITVDKDNPKRGKFEVTNNEEMIKKMIPNRQTYIDPLCDTEGYSGDATTIQTLAPGTVETTNGQIWEATQKAKVKFIKN